MKKSYFDFLKRPPLPKASFPHQPPSLPKSHNLLTPSQVHQIQLPTELLLRLHVLLLDVDKEDAVAARAVFIHVCRRKAESWYQPRRPKPSAWLPLTATPPTEREGPATTFPKQQGHRNRVPSPLEDSLPLLSFESLNPQRHRGEVDPRLKSLLYPHSLVTAT